MGKLRNDSQRPDAIAPAISYYPESGDSSALPLFNFLPFRKIREAKERKTQRRLGQAIRQVFDDPGAKPLGRQIFELDGTVPTPYGQVPAGELGLVVKKSEQPPTYAVALPTRRDFFDATMHRVTEVTLPPETLEGPRHSERTRAITQAISEFAQGNLGGK